MRNRKPGVPILSLIFILLFGFNSLFAQDSNIQLDSDVNSDSVEPGLLKKIMNPIQFRANRNNREKQRMYDYLMNLVSQGNLKMDSAAVNDIISELVDFSKLEPSLGEIDYRVQQGIDTLEFSTSTEEIDSLHALLSNYLVEQRKLSAEYTSIIGKRLALIRDVRIICDQLTIDPLDTTASLNIPCLRPAMRIFGWHHSYMKDGVAKNYNFNYLTDVILDGYKLGADGEAINISDVDTLLNGSLMSKASVEGKGIILSIFNNSPDTISLFLHSQPAIDKFIGNLERYTADYPLTGLNISFVGLKNSDRGVFVSFLRSVSRVFKTETANFQVSLNIPPVSSEEEVLLAGAFDFKELNSLVDFYLVQTDRLVTDSSIRPSSPSPLFGVDNKTRPSIESTISFYTNGNVPVNKLVMTVGYSGIAWVSGEAGERVKYGDIRTRIMTQEYQQAVRGFDVNQASPFVVFSQDGREKVVWYEDGRSLFIKYTWALENRLGGVALWSMGEDDGYPVTWDALAAALMVVDSNEEVNDSNPPDEIQQYHPGWYIMAVLLAGFAAGLVVRQVYFSDK